VLFMHQGTVKLKSFIDDNVIPITLYDVLYFPEWNMGDNLISWSKIDAKGTAYLNLSTGVSEIRMKNNHQIVLRAHLKDGIYHLDVSTILGHAYIFSVQYGMKPWATHPLRNGSTPRKSTTIETFFPSACPILTVLPVRFLIQNTNPLLKNP
jgi:hypothetical protein